MQKHKMVLTLTVGLVLSAGQIAAAQSSLPKEAAQVTKPEPPKRVTAPETRAEVASVLPDGDTSTAGSGAYQPIEIRLLDKTGKTIAQVRVEFPKGQQLEVGADKMTEIAAGQSSLKRLRLEGNIYIKTLRGNVSTTLLKMDGKDAIVEYVMPGKNL